MGNTNFPDGINVGSLSIDDVEVTATAAELNAIAGGGLSAAELGVLDGVVAGTVTAGKAIVTTTNKHIDALVITDGGLALGAGAGTAITSTAAELNLLDGSIAGTAVASKAAVLGTNKNLDILAVADGGLSLGAGAGTAITSTAAELNLLDGSVAGTAVASKALALGANKNVDVLAVADGGLSLGAGAGTAITSTAAELNTLDDSAAFADGLSRVRVASATYDFAEHGGAISAIGLGVTLPDNAIILDGMVDVITTLTTAGGDAGTIALHAEGADDIVTAIAVSDGTNPWDAGLRAIKQLGTSTTATKLTAAREITATIGGQAVTAGKFVVFLRYVLSA